MENAAIAKLIRDKRAGTFGATPQGNAPKPQEKVLKAPEVAKAIAPKAAVPTPVLKDTPPASDPSAPQTVSIVKGVIIGISDAGKLMMQTVGKDTPNYLELVALLEYANTKKKDLIESIAGVGVGSVAQQILNLTASVNSLSQGVNSLIPSNE